MTFLSIIFGQDNFDEAAFRASFEALPDAQNTAYFPSYEECPDLIKRQIFEFSDPKTRLNLRTTSFDSYRRFGAVCAKNLCFRLRSLNDARETQFIGMLKGLNDLSNPKLSRLAALPLTDQITRLDCLDINLMPQLSEALIPKLGQFRSLSVKSPPNPRFFDVHLFDHASHLVELDIRDVNFTITHLNDCFPFQSTTLKRLSINQGDIVAQPNQTSAFVGKLTSLVNLDYLKLESRVEGASFSALMSHLTKLTSFDIHMAANAPSEHYGSITHLTRLDALNLKWSRIGDAQLSRILTTCTRLDSLNLYGTKTITGSPLTALQNLSFLTSLNFGYCDLIETDDFQSFFNLTALKDLRLRGCTKITDLWDDLPQLTQLERLDISKSLIASTQLERLILKRPTLRSLWVGGTTTLQGTQLQMLTQLKTLEVLDVTELAISAQTLGWIKKHNPALKIIKNF